MTNCIICHKELRLVFFCPGKAINFVCICFDCIKKQNKLIKEKLRPFTFES